MADLYTGVTVQGLYDNSTESPLFAATGTAVPTSSILVGGSDGVNIQPLSVDSSGRLNVNASSAPPTDNKATGTLTNPGDTVSVSTEGTSAITIQITLAAAITAGTIAFEASLDGTSWQAFSIYPVLPDGTPSASSTTLAGNWESPVGGFRMFRVRATAGFAGGPATIFLTAGQGQYSVVALSPLAANFNATVVVSGTAAVNLTQVGGSAVTLGQKTMANSFPVVIASDQSAVPVSQSGAWTVSATQGTSPWVDNLTQVAGVALGATAVTAFGTAPAAANVPGVNASLYAGVTGLTATGSSLNTNVTNTVTVTGTVAVTQSTSPWVVAGNLTHNNAAPAANNVGVLPAVASTAAPTYTTGDQVLLSTDLAGSLRVSQQGTVTVTGTVTANQGTSPWVTKDAADGTPGAAAPGTAIQVAGSDGTNLQTIRVSTNRTQVVIPADEALASSVNYFSADQGDTQTSVANPAVKPLLSVRTNSAAIIFLIRGIELLSGGQLVRYQLLKNATLTGSTFATSNGNMQIDTAATSFTGGTVIDSGYFAAAHFIKSIMQFATAGTPGDRFTLVASAISGTIKASGSIQWSEQAAAL